jgi:hypothetical protein
MLPSESTRDEEIIAAYAAGNEIGQIQQRYGVSQEEIDRIVGEGIGLQGRSRPTKGSPGATSSPRTPLAVMGIVMIVLGVSGLLAGIAWLSVYYLSGTEYPISSLGYGNLAVGFSGICVGLVLGLTGLGLVMVSRR